MHILTASNRTAFRVTRPRSVHRSKLGRVIALVIFVCAPTHPGTICRCGHRVLMPPTVPLTVLSRDEWDDDPSHAHTTRPRATSPPPNPPSKPCEPTGRGRLVGSFAPVGVCPVPYGGPSCPAPPPRGLGPVVSDDVCPAPYGGPGCPAPLWGAGATLALVSRDPSWSVVESGV